MVPKIIVLSASDTKFVGLLKEMLASLDYLASDPANGMPAFDVGVFDLGLSEQDRFWLEGRGATVAMPRPHLGFGSPDDRLTLAYLVRPFLPEYFPGYDIYLWIDSDVWLQSLHSTLAMIEGARTHGMAIAHESEKAYRHQGWLFRWTAKHFVLGYGPLTGAWLLTKPHLNAGIFAIHRDAPHWQAWARRYERAMRRTGKITPHDQFALNQAIYQDKLDTAILPPSANWICDRGVPMWNDDQGCFCEPYAPYRPISAIHLAGPGKRTVYPIQRTGGGSFQTLIRYGVAPGAVQLAAA